MTTPMLSCILSHCCTVFIVHWSPFYVDESVKKCRELALRPLYRLVDGRTREAREWLVAGEGDRPNGTSAGSPSGRQRPAWWLARVMAPEIKAARETGYLHMSHGFPQSFIKNRLSGIFTAPNHRITFRYTKPCFPSWRYMIYQFSAFEAKYMSDDRWLKW